LNYSSSLRWFRERNASVLSLQPPLYFRRLQVQVNEVRKLREVLV